MEVTKINNGVDSRYFVIKITGDITTQNDKDAIANWFLSCLSTIDDPAIYTNFDENFSWQVLPNCCTCANEYNNMVYIAIYMRWRLNKVYDATNMIVTTDAAPETNLPITKLSDSLVSYPSTITNIGISGVGRKLLKQEWWNLLDQSNGYLWYNSYYRNLEGNWATQVDISNQYRWDDNSYPFAG